MKKENETDRARSGPLRLSPPRLISSVTNGSSFCRIAHGRCEPIAEGKGRGKRWRGKTRGGGEGLLEGTGKSQSLHVTAAPLVQTSPVALSGHFFPLQRTRHASKTRAVSTATSDQRGAFRDFIREARFAR